ncbi:hypothetical protein Tco_1317033 [Tanacetum coccineum]
MKIPKVLASLFPSIVTDDTNGSISERTDHSYNTSGVTACMSEYTACVNEVTATTTRVTSLTEPTPDFMTEVTTTTGGVTTSVTEHTAKPIGSTVCSVPSSPNKNRSEKVGREHAMNDIPSSYATKHSPTSLTKANLWKLEANMPNDANYDVWLTLASIHEVKYGIKKVTMVKGIFFFTFSSIEDVDSVLRDAAPKRVVNSIDKGKGKTSRADDEGFIEVKKKKSGGNNGVAMGSKSTTLDDDGKPLEKVDYPNNLGSDDEVEPVKREMASFLALKPMGIRYGLKILLEQWRENDVDGDYDPYDDDMYEGQEIPDNIQTICDNLDIKVCGRKKK